jgi:hypothetical protein
MYGKPDFQNLMLLSMLFSCIARIERTTQFVRRRIRLPDSADTSKIEAKYDNGMCTDPATHARPTAA